MITLEPTILNKNGTMKLRVIARDEHQNIIEAETLTVESGRSRKSFVNRLAEKTGETPDTIEAQVLALLDTAAAPPRPPPGAEQLLAEMSPGVRADAESLLADPDLIQRIRLDIRALGLAGDETVALGVYLIGTSRLLDKPLAGIVRGASSSGKSYAIATVAKLFPPESKIEAHHLSAKALYYLPDDALVHKFVVAGERPRRQDDDHADATKPLREMISDGILRAATVESVDGQLRTVRYDKPGPIAYVESTSATTIFAEDANRCLVFNVDEGEEQTRTIVKAMAAAAAGSGASVDGLLVPIHHGVQRLLRPVSVVIPYAPMLAARFPVNRVEARRAMPHLLSTIKAVALLRQHQKQTVNGAIVADSADFGVALDVVSPSLTRLKGGIDQQVRRVWEAIQAHAPGDDEISRTGVASWAGIRESDAGGRMRILCELGYLLETQEHRGNKPAKFKINPDAPTDEPSAGNDLPTVEEVAAYMKRDHP